MTSVGERLLGLFVAPDPSGDHDGVGLAERHDADGRRAAAARRSAAPASGGQRRHDTGGPAAAARRRADGARSHDAGAAVRAVAAALWRPRPAVATLGADACVTLLGSGGDAATSGVQAARALARAARRPYAICCVWAAEPAAGALRAPALPAASAAASRLTARGHVARASGRVVVVTLDGDERAARAEAARVAGGLPGVPSTLALCAPLGEALSPEPGACDAVVVVLARAEPLLAQIAAERLRDANPALPVAVVELGPRARRARGVSTAVLGALR